MNKPTNSYNIHTVLMNENNQSLAIKKHRAPRAGAIKKSMNRLSANWATGVPRTSMTYGIEMSITASACSSRRRASDL